jgi:pimeloyl-ACP methyl ester carboxylesterase
MADVGWQELRIEVQGRPVFVRKGPQVSGSIPLVHVHGFAVSGSYLLPTARALAHRATTFVPDLPGYGQSPGWGHALGVPSLARVLLDVLEALDVGPVVLLGNSMGGPVCLEVAHCAPERVAGVVLCSPAVGCTTSHSGGPSGSSYGTCGVSACACSPSCYPTICTSAR